MIIYGYDYDLFSLGVGASIVIIIVGLIYLVNKTKKRKSKAADLIAKKIEEADNQLRKVHETLDDVYGFFKEIK